MPTVEEKVTQSDELPRSHMIVEYGLNFFAKDTDLLGEIQQLRRTKYLPEQTIQRYLTEALKRANVNPLDDGSLYAEIPGFDGVWASDEDLAVCIQQLREVLLDWLVLKIEHEDRDIPVVDDINLNVL